jgi:17-hydroxy-3-oxo-4-pregnene-20-carboxyl-CoA lyase
VTPLSGQAAVVGIGATEFSKESGRSELRLACEAVLAALADCGLRPADVDGLVTFTMDTNSEIEVARALGLGDLTFFSRIHYGGGAACAVLQQAAMAVACGVAEVVVVYRAFNERSGRRFGAGTQDRPVEPTTDAVARSWTTPYGLLTPAQQVAMFARRYLHEHDLTTEAFGRVAVSARRHAATNPRAWFYERPITLEDHQASRWITEPLRLLDCCQESDGAQALVVTSTERARSLAHPPAVVAGAAQGASRGQHMMTSYYRDDLVTLPELGLVGRQLYAQAGIGPDQVQSAVLYDHFTPFVLVQLEELGFCRPGEADAFVRDGHLDLDGRLPTNTHGGQLGEAYIHGVNGIAEAVRQLRGTAVNQVRDVEHVLITAGTGVPTSGAILRAA